jgi:hypothetical protein
MESGYYTEASPCASPSPPRSPVPSSPSVSVEPQEDQESTLKCVVLAPFRFTLYVYGHVQDRVLIPFVTMFSATAGVAAGARLNSFGHSLAHPTAAIFLLDIALVPMIRRLR